MDMNSLHRNHRSVLNFVFLLFFLLAFSFAGPVKAQDTQKTRIWILIDMSQSIKDNSLTNIPLFMIKYLQTFYPEKADIGLIVFGTHAVKIFGLTPVSDITNDLLLRKFSEIPQVQTSNSAFVEAVDQTGFENAKCAQPHCYFIFLSDSYYTDKRVDITKKFKDIKASGYQIILLKDSKGDLPEGTSADQYYPTWKTATEDPWDTWDKDPKRNLLFPYVTNVNDTFYETLFQKLELRAPELPKKCADLNWEIPPDQKIARINLMMDKSFTAKWSIAGKETPPDQVLGSEYLWITPPTGILSAKLTPISTAKNDVSCWVYETHEYSKLDYTLQAEISPATQVVDKAVEFKASISSISQNQVLNKEIHVYVTINKNKLELNGPDDNGLYSLSKNDIVEGEYDHVLFEAIYRGNTIASDGERRVVVGRIPSLDLKVEDAGLEFKRAVFVVNNFDVVPSKNIYLNINLNGESKKLTDYDKNGQKAVFDFTFNANLNQEQNISAELPTGYTTDGIAYDAQKKEYHQQQVIPLFVWIILVGMFFVFVFILQKWQTDKNVSANVGKEIVEIKKIRSDVFDGKADSSNLVNAIDGLNKYDIIKPVPRLADEIDEIANEIATIYRGDDDQGNAGIVKEELLERAKKNSNSQVDVVLVTLLSALFISCDKNLDNERVLPQNEIEILYQHLFKTTGELHQLVFSTSTLGKNSLAIKPLSTCFLNSYKVALDNHRCDHKQSCPSKKIWQAVYDLLKNLNDLEHREVTEIEWLQLKSNDKLNIPLMVKDFHKTLGTGPEKQLASMQYCVGLAQQIEFIIELDDDTKGDTPLYSPTLSKFASNDPSEKIGSLIEMFSGKFNNFSEESEIAATSEILIGNILALPVLEYKLIEQIIRIGFSDLYDDLFSAGKISFKCTECAIFTARCAECDIFTAKDTNME